MKRRQGQSGAGMLFDAPPRVYVCHRPKGKPRTFSCAMVFDAYIRQVKASGALVAFASPWAASWVLPS